MLDNVLTLSVMMLNKLSNSFTNKINFAGLNKSSDKCLIIINIGGNKMKMDNYFANVIVIDLVNNKEYVVSANVDARDAERIASNINDEIISIGNANKVSVRLKLVDKVNTIQVYKNVVDKVLEVIDNNKNVVAVEDFDWSTYDTNKEVKECIKKCEDEEKREVVKRGFLRKKDMKK